MSAQIHTCTKVFDTLRGPELLKKKVLLITEFFFFTNQVTHIKVGTL